MFWQTWRRNFISVICFFVIGTACSASLPVIVEDIVPEVKKEGETGRLNCKVKDLLPQSVVEWMLMYNGNGHAISEGENIREQWTVKEGMEKYGISKTSLKDNVHQFQLIIRSLSINDVGEYACVIKIPGRSTQKWPKKTVVLTVQLAPRIQMNAGFEENITVKLAEPATLRCGADGLPSPDIIWKRVDGSPLPVGHFKEKVNELKTPEGIVFAMEKTSSYQISNVTIADHGQYMCIADNNIGPTDNITIGLYVSYAPTCIPVNRAVGQAQNRRFDATLNCVVTGYPQAVVKWYRKSIYTGERELIHEDDKYGIEVRDYPTSQQDGKLYLLLIRNVQAPDNTKYFCTAVNGIGSDETSFTVYETRDECIDTNCPPYQEEEG